MAYLTVSEFRARTIMPSEDVDMLEAVRQGYLSAQLADWSDEIDARLRKRYAVPFTVPAPRTVVRWLVKLATRDAYDARGNNPSAVSDAEAIYKAAERAEADLKEAADSKDGLFDLPLRADLTASGVTKGGPLFYSETSPYVWMTNQRDAAEDR